MITEGTPQWRPGINLHEVWCHKLPLGITCTCGRRAVVPLARLGRLQGNTQDGGRGVMEHHDDPVEGLIAEALQRAGHAYKREVRHPTNDRALDFYLPALDAYIEVKQYHSARSISQLEGLTNVILIQGRPAALAFCQLLGGRAAA